MNNDVPLTRKIVNDYIANLPDDRYKPHVVKVLMEALRTKDTSFVYNTQLDAIFHLTTDGLVRMNVIALVTKAINFRDSMSGIIRNARF